MNFKEFIKDANDTFELLENTGKALQLFVKFYAENHMKEDSNMTKIYFLATPSDLFKEKGIEGAHQLCRKLADDY